MLNLIVGFVLGATAIIVADALCVYYLLNRLANKSKSNPDSDSKAREVDHQQSLTFASNKQLNEDFLDHLTSLKAGYPSFMKSTSGFSCEPTDRAIGTDVSSSKDGMSMAVDEEKRTDDKSPSFQDPYPIGTKKTISTEKAFNNHLGEDTVLPRRSPLTQSGSQHQVSVTPDEGTFCWNVLISWLFFDVRHNTDIISSIQTWIQRTLSNMRTLSYIGVTCTSLDLGILPPHIHSMRDLPTDKNEVWAMEIDIEYSGGAILVIETRLGLREAEFAKGIVNANLDSNSVDKVTLDPPEGFDHFGKQLNLSGEKVDETRKKDEGDDKFDGMRKRDSWKSSCMSWCKCIADSIAYHVSQVPISLAIKVASVRGTLKLHIKPDPSDQLWFGFTSMPKIDFNLDSSVGDRKVSSTHVALLLENRFKAAIRETLVLPNCGSVFIPWMLAEKDDWAPKESPETHLAQKSVSSAKENQSPPSEDRNEKRTGRRARMMDLWKKMSDKLEEKLEEKRRNLKEKIINMVEKM